MKKEQRQFDSLFELLKEEAEIELTIASLPRGYISVKHISGHTYNYRQWREGEKIISEYIPEAFLNSVKRKIATRKEREELLKVVRKDVKSVSRKLLKAGLINEQEIAELKEKARQEIGA